MAELVIDAIAVILSDSAPSNHDCLWMDTTLTGAAQDKIRIFNPETGAWEGLTQTGITSDQIIQIILANDGSGSGIDSDTVDGHHYYEIVGAIPVTYAEASQLQLTSAIHGGALYYITDRSIFVHAAGSSAYSLTGMYLCKLPDYQNVGGDFIGVWQSTLVPDMAELCAWGGLMYENLTGANGVSNPTIDTTNWKLVPTSSGSYITEYHQVEYDFDNDWIQRRKDTRGNDIMYSKNADDNIFSSSGIQRTGILRWGDDKVRGNKTYEGYIDNQNDIIEYRYNNLAQGAYMSGNSSTTSGSYIMHNDVGQSSFIKNNTITGSGVLIWKNRLLPETSIHTNTVATNGFIVGNLLRTNSTINNNSLGNATNLNENHVESYGGITSNTLVSGSFCAISENNIGFGLFVSNKTLNANISLNSCRLTSISLTGAETITSNITSKRVESGYSNVPKTISITGLTTLDITTVNSYAGIINATSTNAAETINLFANFPSNHPVRIYPASGLVLTFTHATGANQPTCSGAVNAVVNGTNGDWIEFTKKGSRIYQTGGTTY